MPGKSESWRAAFRHLPEAAFTGETACDEIDEACTDGANAGFTPRMFVLSRFQRVNRRFAIKLVVAQVSREMRL
jgi:hypothetical protein